MIVTKGYGSNTIVTQGYGGVITIIEDRVGVSVPAFHIERRKTRWITEVPELPFEIEVQEVKIEEKPVAPKPKKGLMVKELVGLLEELEEIKAARKQLPQQMAFEFEFFRPEIRKREEARLRERERLLQRQYNDLLIILAAEDAQ